MFLLPSTPSVGMMELLSQIRKKIEILIRSFEDIENRYKNLDFSNIIFILNACKEAVPTTDEDEEDLFNEVNENVRKVVVSLRENILNRKLSLEEVFSIFDADKNGNISKSEFKNGIKSLLKIQAYDLESCFNFFAVDGVLRLSDFSTKLRKSFSRKRDNENLAKEKIKATGRIVAIEDNTKNSRITKDFKLFTNKFTELCNGQDIYDLVNKIRIYYVDPAIAKNDHSVLKEFVSKLGSAFKKKIHKIYLLQILKLLIPANIKINSLVDEENEEQIQQLSNIRNTQIILSKSGVLELALTIISTEHELNLVDEAVQLLISMLNYGNQAVQEKFLEILRMSDNSYFFSYIRLKLRQSRDRIVDRAKVTYEKNPEKALQGKVPNSELEENGIFNECRTDVVSTEKGKHVKALIFLLQLCCENCFSEFQHYIRSQEEFSSGKKAISINMVNEIAQYLINIKEVGPELMNDNEATMIIPQCYETLIDLCRGPCIENQKILGQRRKLYKFIDNIITDPKFENSFFECAVSFLKVLLEGNCNKEIASIMIEEINFEQLANRVFSIYKEKIHDRTDLIIQENFFIEEVLSFIHFKRKSREISLED